jgi:Tfp pilus assembly protein PilF
MEQVHLRMRIAVERLLAVTAAILISAIAASGQSSPRQAQSGVPEELVPVFNRGVQALQAGQYYVAESAFLEVLKKGGPSSLVYTNLGTIYQQRGDHKKAVENLERSVRLAPRSAPPKVLLGSSFLALGRIPEATTQLEAAARLAPKDPLAHLQLAKAYARAKNLLKSVDEFQAARALVPADPELAYRLGNSYLEVSVWTLREIIRLKPKSPRVDQTMAETFRAQGRNDMALRFYQFAAENDPTLPDVHLAMAQIHQSMGKSKEALEEANRELAIVPGHAAALELKRNLEAAAPTVQ